MKKCDIVVNPWVPKEYNGDLNPMYATIYIGDNCSIDYYGRSHRWGYPIYKANEEERTPWKVIGHVDLKGIIENVVADTPQTDCIWKRGKYGEKILVSRKTK